MATSMPTPTLTRAPEPAPQLVRHASQPRWGCGALVRNAPTKRSYQFEDGRTRTFKKGFYHLLEPVDLPENRAEKLADQLIARADDRAEVREARAEAEPIDKEEMKARLERQVAFFLGEFPEGFSGDRWKARYRGDEGRSLKRHRDPIIAEGQKLFSEESLQTYLDEEDPKSFRDAWLALLEQTDLVTPARRRAIKSARVNMPWLQSLQESLYGEGVFAVRFERWVAESERLSDKAASWSLVTAPFALVMPGEHLVVRHSRMKTLMGWMRPGYPLPKRPGAPTYAELQKVVAEVVQALDAAGHTPADLFDVYDFIQLTTTTKAREAIK